MKYIRTKDGRIAEIKENMIVKVSDDATRLVYKNKPWICVLHGDDGILNQADTIEELCDEFICKRPSGETYILDRPFNLKAQQKYIGEIYGAIWITGEHSEPILKTVAKLKGVLPNGEIDWELL